MIRTPSSQMGQQDYNNTVKIQKSSTIRGQILSKANQKISLPSPSPSLSVGLKLGSVPVTPDPNSSSKRNTWTKSDGDSGRTATKKPSKRSTNSSSSNMKNASAAGRSHVRLNKFVTRLHDMLIREKQSGIVEWRRGLLVLFSTDAFTKRILPKYFNTRNFKTFRRQLNYYGFVHVRSFSATGNITTALWINQHLAKDEANDDVSAVLKLRRVEPDEDAKTVEGRRLRKELAIHTVIGLDPMTLQRDQIRSMAILGEGMMSQKKVSPTTTQFSRPLRSGDKVHGGISFDNTGGSKSANMKSKTLPDSVNGARSICRSNDDPPATESSRFGYSMPKLEEEVARTDAAASVLLMLSRS